MVCFDILPSRTTASITDEKASRRVGTAVHIQVNFLQQFMPHPCSRLSIFVSCSSCEEDHGEVELSEHRGHLGLEMSQVSLVTLESFGVTPEADAALVGENGYIVPAPHF